MTELVNAKTRKAPFRLVDVGERRGPIRFTDPQTGVTMECGAPGQPMGVCDYCGQGIAVCCTVRGADGRQFTVGSDCVRKVYKDYDAPTDADKALQRAINKEIRKMQVAREETRIESAFAALDADPALRTRLDSNPAPRGRGSVLDWVQFCRRSAGHAGQLRAARTIEQYQKGD